MSPFQAIILGTVQGLTEFLPISSSGHLILFPTLFRWGIHSLAFDTVLHMGTAVSLVVFFFSDLKEIFRSFFRDLSQKGNKFSEFSHDGKMIFYLLFGSLPAVIFGVLFESSVESIFRSVSWVAIFLILGSVLMLLAEKISIFAVVHKVFPFLGKVWDFAFKGGEKIVNVWRSIIVGIFQSAALFPGVSRSGATISGGMLMGFSREYAARFSFLLSIPVVIGAALYKVLESYQVLFLEMNIFTLFLGFVASFVTGVFAIKFLMNFVKKYPLYIFVIYRLLLAIFLLRFLVA